jgi:two-component system LytT family response regulator
MADDLRVIMVDDEEPARRLLREYLEATPGVSIVAECGNGFEAVKAVAENEPDLMLLDIQMPKLDGFEVVELLERDLPIIFITAHDEHALRAFDVHAVDYLLKPYSAQRLADALYRARDRIGRGDEMPPIDELAADARPDGGDLERILVRDGSDVRVIPAEEVDYIEARDRPETFHPGPPLVHPQHRPPAQHRALRQGQPHRDPRGRHQGAGQPVRLLPASRAVMSNPQP